VRNKNADSGIDIFFELENAVENLQDYNKFNDEISRERSFNLTFSYPK
jgi:hypothetical protein